MATSKSGIGVVGAGDIAHKAYFPAVAELAKQGKAELVAVCDLDEGRAAAARERYGAKRHYSALDRMLEDDEVQLVLDIVPGPAHFAVNLASLKAGKHVYSEKPFVNTVAQGRKLIEAAKASGVRLFCAPAVMLDQMRKQIRQLVADGTVGKVYFAVAKRAHPGPARMGFWPADPTWFYKEDAGPLRDMGVYGLTTLTGVLGSAKKVSAVSGVACPEVTVQGKVRTGQKLAVEADDNTGVMLDFGDATFAFLFAGFGVQWLQETPSLELYGSNGNIYISSANELQTLIEGRGSESTNPNADEPWNVSDGLPHLVDCLQTGDASPLDPDHALHVVDIIEKAFLSARSGKAMALETTFDLET